MNIHDDTLLVIAPENTQILVRDSVAQIPGLEFTFETVEKKVFERIYTHDFVLIVLDLALPEMDASSICAMLNSHRNSHNPPILIIDRLRTQRMDELDDLIKAYPELYIDFCFSPFDTLTLKSKFLLYYEFYRLRTTVDQSRRELDKVFKQRMDEHDLSMADKTAQKKINMAVSLAHHQIQQPLRSLWASVGHLQKNSHLEPTTQAAVSSLKQSAKRIDQLARQALFMSQHLPESGSALPDGRVFNILYTEASDEDYRLFHHLIKGRLPCRILRSDSIQKSLSILGDEPVDLIILTQRLNDGSSLKLLTRITHVYPDIPVILLVTRTNLQMGPEYLSKGAAAFFIKERLSPDTLFLTITGTLAKSQINQEAESAKERITLFSSRDAITKLMNRSRFETLLDQETTKAKRYRANLSVVIIRFNRLEHIFQAHGPSAADQALIFSAALIREMIRECDVLCRYDTHLFAVLLPHTDHDGARILTQRIKKKMKEVAFDHQDVVLSLSISAGAATFNPNSGQTDGHPLIDSAIETIKDDD